MGLYGLVSFMSMSIQRTKEMGIRKVLGASTRNILYLFSREFTIMVIVAFVIAGPVAAYFMTNWLQKFPYRIELSVGIFLIAIFFSIIISWITVSYHALKAASVNPIKSLQTE